LEDGQASVFLKETEIVFEPFIFTPEGAFSSFYFAIRPVAAEASEHWVKPGARRFRSNGSSSAQTLCLFNKQKRLIIS